MISLLSSIKNAKQPTLSKNQIAFYKSICDRPESFSNGLGKNVKSHVVRHMTQKQKNKHKKSHVNYNHDKRVDKYYTQGISDIFSNLGSAHVPSGIKSDVEDMMMPISEINDFIKSDTMSNLVNIVNKISDEGVQHDHSHHIHISEEMYVLIFIVVLVLGSQCNNKFMSTTCAIGSTLLLLKQGNKFGLGPLFGYVMDLVKEYVYNNKDDDDDRDPDEVFYECQSLDPSIIFRGVSLIVVGYSIFKNHGRIGASSLCKIDSFIKALPIMSLTMRHGDDILTYVLTFVEKITNTIGQLFDEKFHVNFKGETWYEYEVIRKKLEVLMEQFETRENLGSVANKAKLLLKELRDLGVPKESKVYPQYRDLINAIGALVDDLARFGAVGNCDRKEPFVIVIGGEPGVGKSSVKTSILNIMAKHILPAREFPDYVKSTGSFVYVPNQAEKFMSGYSNQTFVVCDDLGYSKTSMEVMLPRFITMVNSTPYNVEQAELHRKGAVYFDSEVILATTNIGPWPQMCKELHFPEALCRRLHMTFWVEVKPEYRIDGKEKVDFSKVPKDAIATCSWLNWFKSDPYTGRKTKLCACGYKCNLECKPATMRDALLMCVDEYDARTNLYNSIKADNSAMLNEMLQHPMLNTKQLIDMFHGSLTQGRCLDWCDHCNILSSKDLAKLFEKYFNRACEDPKGDKCECGYEKHDLETFEAASKHIDLEFKEHGMKSMHILKYQKMKKCYIAQNGAHRCDFSICEYLLTRMDARLLEEKQTYRYFFNCLTRKLEFVYDDTIKTFKKAGPYLRTIKFFVKKYFLQPFIDVWNNPIFQFCFLPCVALTILPILLNFTGRKVGEYFAPKRVPKQRCNDGVKYISNTQGADPNGVKLMKSVVHSNVMQVYIDNCYFFTVLGLGGSVIALNEHLAEKIRNWDTTEIEFRRFGKKNNQWSAKYKLSTIDFDDMYYFEDNDLVAINIPGLECHSLEVYANNEILSGRNTYDIGVAWFNPDTEYPEYNIRIGAMKQPLTVRAHDKALDKYYVTCNSITYKIPTEAGLCGAPVFMMDATKTKKFVGIHCAGDGIVGNACRVTQTMIADCFSFFKDRAFVVQDNVITMSKENVFYGEQPVKAIDDCQVIGRVNNTVATLKSEICKSPLYNRIPGFAPNKMPAILVPQRVDGKIICPIEKNLAAYARGFIQPDLDVLSGVTTAYITHLRRNTQEPKEIRFMTFEESVMGCPELKYFRSIKRGTSAGYPDKLYLGNKKRDAFGGDTEFLFDTKEALIERKAFDEAMLALEDGPIEMIANIFPKDELRPKAKAKALKTRIIAGFSCHATLVIRSIFGSFIDWFSNEENRIENGSALGANVASYDWTKIAQKHGYGDPNRDVKAGDHGSFDKNLNPFFMEVPFKVWMEFFGVHMTEKERTIARNCWKSLMAVKVVCKDNLIAWGNSNPSGNPLTTPINTICNIVILMYSITKVLIPGQRCPVYIIKFWDKLGNSITITCYGDDNIWSYDKLCPILMELPALTYENVSNEMAKIGFVYTDEMKSETFDESSRTIFNVTFLKRTFMKEKGTPNLLAPLDLETIVQNIQWKKKYDTNDELFRIKFEGFLGELSVHDKETYDTYLKLLLDAWDSAFPDCKFLRNVTQAERRVLWSKVIADL